MKKKESNVSNPDELNTYLQHTFPFSWIVLGLVSLVIIGFFAWSFVYKIKIRLFVNADIVDKTVSLNINEKDLDKIAIGQKVFISGKEGKILSFYDNKPVVSSFELDDGSYECYVVINEKRPIEYFVGR